MRKDNPGLFKQLFSFIIAHPWLKLFSLILAILVWFYVKDQISRVIY